MAAQVVARTVDLGFAIFMLRVLGPVDFGGYAFAGALIGYFVIFSDFGLGTLLTREVARRPEEGPRYLGNVISLRLILWIAAAPVLAGLAWVYHAYFGLSQAAMATAVLLMLAVGPGGLAGALSGLFLAHERMEVPAAVVIFTSLMKALLGIAVLLLGWGILGVGAVAIATNGVTAMVFWGLVSRRFFRPGPALDRSFGLGLLRTSVPLVLNSLLNSVFFRIDVLLLQAMRNAETVGLYSTAYKFVDALLIIPSAFTLALFPLMARQGIASPEDLRRTYSRGLRVLLLAALPAAVGISLVAEDLVVTLFGPAYREAGGTLRLLIWFLPFSYVNGLTQYVLIALNHQRFITAVFLAAAGFNLAGNILLIPEYGAHGAAATTIASELVLLGPFLVRTSGLIGRPQIVGMAVRAGMAAAVMGAAMLLLGPLPFWALLPAGGVVYVGAAAALRVLGPEDIALLRRLVRGR
jgi:O-antigen/teichoic acid export membrane protein